MFPLAEYIAPAACWNEGEHVMANRFRKNMILAGETFNILLYIYVVVVLTDVKVHFLFVWTRRLNYNLESGWGHTTAAAAATTTLGWGRTTAAAAAITLVLVAGTI